MSLYDHLTFDDGLDIEFPGFEGDPFDLDWQTKTAQHHPFMERFRINSAGRLLKEDVEYEVVPEEERPYYDEEIGGFGDELEAIAGMIHTEHLGWSDVEFHGILEFYTSIEGEYESFKAKFTDGELVEIRANE